MEELVNKCNVLLAYFATSNVFNRLAVSLSEQLSSGVKLDAYKRVLVTNEVPSDPVISSFFDGNIICIDPYLIDGYGVRRFGFSVLRNAVLDYAISEEVDWLFFCDSDTVVFNNVFVEPNTLFSVPNVYWQESEGESVEDSFEYIKNSEATYSKGNSWFILHRSIFNHARFNERIIGYGYEDIDFYSRLVNSGVDFSLSENVVVHVFHDHGSRDIDPALFEFNEKIMRSAERVCAGGYDLSGRRYISLSSFSHPHWESDLLFVEEEGCCFHMISLDRGMYFISNNQVAIYWPSHACVEIYEGDSRGGYRFACKYDGKYFNP